MDILMSGLAIVVILFLAAAGMVCTGNTDAGDGWAGDDGCDGGD